MHDLVGKTVAWAVYHADVSGDQYVTVKFDDGTVLFITHSGSVSELQVAVDGTMLDKPSFELPQEY